MNTKQEIKLSSNWTNFGLYFGSFLLLVMTPVLIAASKDQEFHWGMVLAGLIYLVMIGFMIYLFTYLCSAKVVGDKLILKKQFRPEQTYSFDQIGYPKSFYLKRAKYITVEMKSRDNLTEKYIIMNSNSLLSFESKDAEQTLLDLRNTGLHQNLKI